MAQPHADLLREISSKRDRQTVGLLRIFALYRVVVSGTLVLLFRQGGELTRLGQDNPELFSKTALSYALVNLLILVAVNFLPRPVLNRSLVVSAVVAMDCLIISWLTYLSGGVDSGLAPLLLVTIAAGAILTASRASIFLAALASLALLSEEIYMAIGHQRAYDGVFQAGVFGVLFFTVAQAIQSISARLRDTEMQALIQAAELADLGRVNRRIIRRMRTGIILVDSDNSVRMGNQSAYALLGIGKGDSPYVANTSSSAAPPPSLPGKLLSLLDAWRTDNNHRARAFQVTSETPEIKVNFSAVRSGASDADVIVFIEDTSEIAQQAQQLKLAALGRLSASIAHEIRNPLGAIAHAAQLLDESENVDHGDRRLIDIINNHSKRMNRVIENILELSRRKAPDPTRLNLRSVLDDFIVQFRVAELETANISISVTPDNTSVRMDRSQLLQVLTNLGQNGLRYSLETSGTLSLKLQGGIDPTTDRPFLNVIDDGPGVEDEHRATLFEPFFTTEHNGTGLGLYIAREMCEANQARLSYVDLPNAGACFRITFAHPDRITV